MRKGSTRRPQDDSPAVHVKNYITPGGLERLKEEHQFLLTKDRPIVTEVVAWAASNGDRNENADYQYAKRRLRQIDAAAKSSKAESALLTGAINYMQVFLIRSGRAPSA